MEAVGGMVWISSGLAQYSFVLVYYISVVLSELVKRRRKIPVDG